MFFFNDYKSLKELLDKPIDEYSFEEWVHMEPLRLRQIFWRCREEHKELVPVLLKAMFERFNRKIDDGNWRTFENFNLSTEYYSHPKYKAPTKNVAARRSESRKIKIGRSCFTCKHRLDRKGEFVTCRHTDKGTRWLWSQAHCPKWLLSKNPRRLSQFERFVDTKYLLRNPAIAQYYYWKYNNITVGEPVNIVLGQTCFLCEFRGIMKGEKVECNINKGMMVWKRARCSKFKLHKDHQWLAQCEKYMRKSGIDTKGFKWLRNRLPWYRYRPSNINSVGLEKEFGGIM